MVTDTLSADDKAESYDSGRPRPHSFYVGLLVLLTLMMSLPGLAALPLIDRDEARYAQASLQMIEDKDYLEIKIQDEAYNKVPHGGYWAQVVSVKALSDAEQRQIWAHRLPSVLAAILAVLATYWAGAHVLGRRAGFWSGATLVTTMLMVYDSHLAKPEALLCAFAAIVMASLIRLRSEKHSWTAFILWTAMGAAILVKGPVVPVLLLLTCITLLLWERDGSWLKNLVSWPGFLMAALIVIPWAVAAWQATDGTFFNDAIGGNLLPSLTQWQGKFAPPAYYLLSLPLFFWPGTLFLFSAGEFAYGTVTKTAQSTHLKSQVRLLICWILPFWILLELIPTKMPSMILPVYPALAVLCGGALKMLITQQGSSTDSDRFGAVVYSVISVVLLFGIYNYWVKYDPVISELSILYYLFTIFMFGVLPGLAGIFIGWLLQQRMKTSHALRRSVIGAIAWTFFVMILFGIVTFDPARDYSKSMLLFNVFNIALFVLLTAVGFVAKSTFNHDYTRAAKIALLMVIVASGLTYQYLLPSLTNLNFSSRVKDALAQAATHLPAAPGTFLSPQYSEPSLVYYLGRDIVMGDKAMARIEAGLAPGDIILVDGSSGFGKKEQELAKLLTESALASHIDTTDHCIVEAGKMYGHKSSIRIIMTVKIYQVAPCENGISPETD